MKYVIFAMSFLCVPPLAFLLALNSRWTKYAFFGMVAGICFYQRTAINFFSREFYLGSSRGIEISLIHLLSLAILLSLRMRGKSHPFLPDLGFKLYAVFFLMCLPSVHNADKALYSFMEIWKMMALFIIYWTAYTYMKTSGDVRSIILALAILMIANFFSATKAHFSGVYQASGVFPHQNSMGMAALLLGPVFFAGYISRGVVSHFGRICFLALAASAIATFWSYSRGAIALTPIAYGIPLLVSIRRKSDSFKKIMRIAPLAIIAAIGLSLIMPRIIDRYLNAPKASGDTRIHLAACAREMIKDKPFIGVGINNWSLKMDPRHPYQDRAAEYFEEHFYYRGIVETVYLLVAAECGIPALLAMLAWFGWYWVVCARLIRKLRGTPDFFIPAGLLGGLTANYMQSFLEWVLRQSQNLMLLCLVFAVISYLNWRENEAAKAASAAAAA